MTQEEFLIALGNTQGNTQGNTFLGAEDDITAPFAKQSGNYGDYINFNEPFQRPGTWEWQKGYDPTGGWVDSSDSSEEKEFNPMLMKALINQKNRRGIESLYNYDLVDAQTSDEQSNADDSLIPEEKKKNIFASIIDLMSQGGIGRVLADSFRNKVTNTPSMQAWRNFSAPQRTAAAGMYQPGGVLQGYNPVSMFGKGPMGSLQKRADAMIKRRDAGKTYSQPNLNKVMSAMDKLESNPANVGRAPGAPRHSTRKDLMAKGGIAGLRG